MYKRMNVSYGNTVHPLIIRNYDLPDIPGLLALQETSFPPPFPPELWWNEEQLLSHVRLFPEGALCADINGTIVGSMTAMRVNVQTNHEQDWATVTDDGYIRNHDPDGDTLYVVDICVSPLFRKFGVGKWLMQSMYETVVYLGAARLLGGGRMPGYIMQADKLTPEQYVDKVCSGKLIDPVLTFLLKCGRMPYGIVANYLEDEQSLHYAALMVWNNPFIKGKSLWNTSE